MAGLSVLRRGLDSDGLAVLACLDCDEGDCVKL